MINLFFTGIRSKNTFIADTLKYDRCCYSSWEALGLLLLWVIIRLHCQVLFNLFCIICLNLSREYKRVHFTTHPAASISSRLVDKHQRSSSTGSYHTTVFSTWALSLPLLVKGRLGLVQRNSFHTCAGSFRCFQRLMWPSCSSWVQPLFAPCCKASLSWQ